jgi:hypothetical protein
MNKNFVAMPAHIEMHNGSHERCDMLIGYCSCGAWHRIGDWVGKIENIELYTLGSENREVKDENTLTIMQYDADTITMRNILDNLVVWDRERKVHYKDAVTYREEKKARLKGSYSMFIITAHKEPLLVFCRIGELIQKRINNPMEEDMPSQPV